MNIKFTKKEKILLIGLVALLIGYGIYQTVYATNESSYKTGYSLGSDDSNWKRACTDFESDCNTSCGVTSNDTACTDGYIVGWEHWCSGNLELCEKLVMNGLFPGKLDASVIPCFKSYPGGGPNTCINLKSESLV
jgi:hypothetical protein